MLWQCCGYSLLISVLLLLNSQQKCMAGCQTHNVELWMLGRSGIGMAFKLCWHVMSGCFSLQLNMTRRCYQQQCLISGCFKQPWVVRRIIQGFYRKNETVIYESEVLWGMGQEGFKGEEQKFANDIQILTGSRCRRLRVGGMCCQGLVQLRILAAKFCGYWSLSRALNGTPNRTPLQWSSWEVLKSWIKISGMV